MEMENSGFQKGDWITLKEEHRNGKWESFLLEVIGNSEDTTSEQASGDGDTVIFWHKGRNRWIKSERYRKANYLEKKKKELKERFSQCQ